LLESLAITIDNSVGAPIFSVFDAASRCFKPQIELAGGLRFWNLRVEGAPFCTHLASLHAKTLLNTETASIVGAGIDGQVARVDLFVAELFRTRVHHFEIVRRGQPGNAVAPGDTEACFRELVVLFEFFVGERPVN
jgi:hypothetical protein